MRQDELQRLRAVDPARDQTRPYSADERSAITVAITESDNTRAPSTRRWRIVAISTAAAVTAAVLVAPVLWPHRGETPMAYGINSKPDGSVDVLLPWSELLDLGATQAALRAAGVPAVVIRQTWPCDNTVDPDGEHNSAGSSRVIGLPSGQAGIVIHPSKIPRGDYVVFGLPPLNSAVPSVAVFVTPTPPTCIAAPH